MILRAQRERRQALGQTTEQDTATQLQYEDISVMKRFTWIIRVSSGYELEPSVERNGATAIARFTVDGRPFTIRKDGSEFVLLAGDEPGRVLARVPITKVSGDSDFFSAIGDFLGVSGTENPLA